MPVLDALEITQRLIQHPSITPSDAGCSAYIQDLLSPFGFACHIVNIHEVTNFYARLGNQSPHLCFLGHVDVVPIGNKDLWTVNPFGGEIIENKLFGRGASDMKGAIGAFVAAIANFLATQRSFGSISMLLTSDEEGQAEHGIRAMIPWLQEKHQHIDACITGEPTNPSALGQMIKIGRRGSLNGTLTIIGKAGHVAYPDQALNPVPFAAELALALTRLPLKNRVPQFQESNLEITSIDASNPTSNMIASQARIQFNVRFNPAYTGNNIIEFIKQKIEEIVLTSGKDYRWTLSTHISGEAFITNNEEIINVMSQAIEEIHGEKPEKSTSGGTSDARFIQQLCPVIEYGLTSHQAHQINEYAFKEHIITLTKTYQRFMELYFDN